MKLWRHLLALFCAFNASAASADVMYRWETSSLAPAIVSLEGTLVFSDEAYAAGRISLSLHGECWTPGQPIELCAVPPDSPIKLFTMSVTTQNVSDATQPHAHSVMPFFPFENTVESFSINVTFGDYLSGSLFAYKPYAEGAIFMNGSHLWTISTLVYFNNHCYANQSPCSGSPGYWRKVENDQIPEPPAILLLGIGLLALISVRLGPTTVQLPLRRSEKRLPTA